MTRNVVAA